MKNTMLAILTLFALGTLTQAADSLDDKWNQMFQVMFSPQNDKAIRLDRLKALIKEGADVNAPILFDRMLRQGETRAALRGTGWPLDVAVRQDRLDMVKLLLASGAKCHGRELCDAALYGSKETVLPMIQALLEAGADVNSLRDSFTALFWASSKGYSDAVKLLLAQPGIKLDQQNGDGTTALMAAAENGYEEIVEMLLKAGANTAPKNNRGLTAAALAQKTIEKHERSIEKQLGIISALQARPK